MSATVSAPTPVVPGGRDWRSRALTVAIPGAAVAFTFWAVYGLDATFLSVYTIPSIGFIAAGMAAWAARPESRTGRLLTLCGGLLLPPLLQDSHVPLPYTVGLVLDSAFAPLLFYTVFAFPSDRLRNRIDALLVLGSLLVVIVIGVVAPLFLDPRDFGCQDCPPGLNLLLVQSQPEIVRAIFTTVPSYVVPVLSTAMIVRLVQRVRRASPPGRRILLPLTVATITWLSVHSYIRVVREVFDLTWNEPAWISTFNAVVLGTIPVAMLLGLQRGRARRSRIGELIVELGHARSAEGLESAIARTLGDPTAEVAFWDRDGRRYVTGAGIPLQPPEGDDARVATYLEGAGEPLAVIVHDRAITDEPRLVQGVAAATRFAVENERLQAEVRSQLEEVRRSRVRIVTAADAERRRIERNLHDGAQQRLLALALDLRVLADTTRDAGLGEALRRSAAEAASAFEELRELSHGLHPSVLTDAGLAAAVEYLAERSMVPVAVTATSERCDPQAEATAYYAVAESLVNVAKHAQATRASVTIERVEERLVVEVFDDGVGGAQPGAGTGLRGLEDRVAAVGGRLELHSEIGQGTRVRVEIPCES